MYCNNTIKKNLVLFKNFEDIWDVYSDYVKLYRLVHKIKQKRPGLLLAALYVTFKLIIRL